MSFEEVLENLYWSILSDDPLMIQQAISQTEEILGFNFRTYEEERNERS